MRGWESVPLAEVARIERRVVEPGDIDPESIYVGLEHIRSDGSFLGPSRVGIQRIESAKFVFSRRHLLYGKLRPYLAKIACPEFDGICSTDILPVLPGPRINRRFLHHFLRLPHVVERATTLSAGANLPRLSPSVLETFEIPLPSQWEQDHIAKVLDSADALRTKRRAAFAQIDGLTQSIFLEMFGDPVTNPRHWPARRVDEVGDVVTGNTPPRSDPSLFGDAIDWVKSDNLNSSLTYVTRSAEGLSEQGKAVGRIVPAGAILVTCIAGTPACIGNAAVADREVAFNQQINALVPKVSETLFLFVQLTLLKRAVQEASTGGMKGMVSKSRFEGIRLIHPPVPLQAEFASRAAAVDKLKAAHRASLAELDALFASLQHRAFRGEL